MLKRITTNTVSLFISLLVGWTMVFLVIQAGHFIEKPWLAWGKGVLNELIATGGFMLCFLPFYFIFNRLKKGYWFIHLCFLLILLFDVLSGFYFNITIEPIGNTIFQYSGHQAALIVKSFFVFRWFYLLIPLPLLVYLILNRILKVPYQKIVLSLFGILGFFMFWNTQLTVGTGSYQDMAKNKLTYFIQSVFFNAQKNHYALNPSNIIYYQQLTNPSLNNPTYPLYRDVSDANPLAPFFNLKKEPPNIMYIFVESLSSSYSGPRADEISYTPFLDSLATKSLYFDNSLATAQRSFAALPSTLGSLPHGKSGYSLYHGSFPDNMTFPKWLFKNGYTGSFHYGGYARFDYMDVFMDEQGFSHIYSRNEYNYAGTGLKTSIDSIPFGLSDKKMFKQSLQHLKNRINPPPYFDVYFTLSTHYPFMIPHATQYYKEVEKRIKAANVSEKIKQKNRKYVKELASFLYLDDALKYFFHEQQKTKAYQNTIYVILGDHMMGDIPQNNPMEEYRSVLMIYSPLLKRNKVIRGVNSQLDISPSLYQLIQHHYDFPALKKVSWLGQPFDTSAYFHCNRDILFILNSREKRDLLHGDYFYSDGKVYQVKNRLKLQELNNQKLVDSLEKLRQIASKVHRYVVEQNKLIPSVKPSKTIAQITQSIQIDAKDEYKSVWSHLLKNDYSKVQLFFDIQLKKGWKNSSERDAQPLLVLSLKRKDSLIYWERMDLDLIKRPINEERHIGFSIQDNLAYKIEKGDVISLYFWKVNKDDPTTYTLNLKSLEVKAR